MLLVRRSQVIASRSSAPHRGGIKKHLSPYFMRRTFQDLCRAAQVHDLVARSSSGHATVEMHQHYSSVSALEVRDGLAKVVSLMDFQRAREQAVSDGR